MTVIPTSYFGSIAYFSQLLMPDVQVEIQEHFVKQTHRNRCSILTANGVQHLSVPVIKPNGNKTLTRDILVSPKLDWRKDHWKAIESAYASAPFFEHYANEIRSLIYAETPDLKTFNEHIMRFVADALSLDFSINYTASYSSHVKRDFRLSLPEIEHEKYIQVLFNQSAFVANLSILDALFCEGPLARKLVLKSTQEYESH